MFQKELSLYTHDELSEYTHEQLAKGLPFNFITDRTSLDVERWKMLRDKGWSRMTTEDRREWLGETIPTPAATRGMYTHVDLNRVEGAVEVISERLRDLGYKVPKLIVKTDWTHKDKLYKGDMERYYSNISTLRELAVVYPTTPMAPNKNNRLDYNVANDIEKILVDIDAISAKQLQTRYYVGDLFSGEV